MKLVEGLPQGDITKVYAQGGASAVLTEDGQVFFWRAGTGAGAVVCPIKLPIPNDCCIKKVACGADFLILLATNGRLFSLGDNQYG